MQTPGSKSMISMVGICVTMVLLVAASISDLAARSVPNWMPVALAAGGLAMQIASHHLAAAILVTIAVFMIAAWCWRRGLMGGGDAKLLAAVSLVVRPASVGMLVVAIALAGGVLALAYAALRCLPRAHSTHAARHRIARMLRVERRRIQRGSIPYAVAIAGGTAYMLATGLAA